VPPRIYPTVAEAIEIHRILIDEFGGPHGIRDRALLESAIFRPQNGHYAGVMEEAAALMESLAKNHAFIDGNKRISFVLTDIMLESNGCSLRRTADYCELQMSRPQETLSICEGYPSFHYIHDAIWCPVECNQKRFACVTALWIAPGLLCGWGQESTLREIPSLFIRKYKVERFSPKRDAAPPGPPRIHRVSFSVLRIWLRSTSSRV